MFVYMYIPPVIGPDYVPAKDPASYTAGRVDPPNLIPNVPATGMTTAEIPECAKRLAAFPGLGYAHAEPSAWTNWLIASGSVFPDGAANVARMEADDVTPPPIPITDATAYHVDPAKHYPSSVVTRNALIPDSAAYMFSAYRASQHLDLFGSSDSSGDTPVAPPLSTAEVLSGKVPPSTTSTGIGKVSVPFLLALAVGAYFLMSPSKHTAHGGPQ